MDTTLPFILSLVFLKSLIVSGRSVANFRELLPQFVTNSHEIWQRCLPWSVDVQDTFFDSDKNHGNHIMAKIQKSCVANFPQNSHEWCLPWGVDVQDTFFVEKECCHGTAYYGKNGANLGREFPVFHQSHEIWHRCLLGV